MDFKAKLSIIKRRAIEQKGQNDRKPISEIRVGESKEEQEEYSFKKQQYDLMKAGCESMGRSSSSRPALCQDAITYISIANRKVERDNLHEIRKLDIKHASATTNLEESHEDGIPGNKIIQDDMLELERSNQRRRVISWTCASCKQECIPVRRESRCLCGHRLKEHNNESFQCDSKGCKCVHFLFIVAEGAWILRCRCKHKHIDHDCTNKWHPCNKCTKEKCKKFDSPWVCNCGHPWSVHVQSTVERNLFEIGPQLQDVFSGNRTFAVRQDGILAQEIQDDETRER